MKKKTNVILKVVQTLVILLAIYIFSNTIISLASGKIPTIFNRNFFIVQTDSMEDEIKVDSLIISKKIDIKDVKEEDIITFVCIDPDEKVVNEVITHRVSKIEIIDGKTYITTKSDKYKKEDKYKVTEDNFVGIVTVNAYALGKIISTISNGGFIIILFVIFLVIASIFLKQVKLYRKSKYEESEKERKEKLKLELLKELKEELAKKED